VVEPIHQSHDLGQLFPQCVELRARPHVGPPAVGPLPYRLVELVQGLGRLSSTESRSPCLTRLPF
jgi:hypothetical protein